MDRQLKELTSILLELVEKGKEQFEKSKSSGQEGDFFLEVKPFADSVKNISDEWIVMATKWLLSEKPKFVNSKQLETTYDHLEKISIQCFYPKTSRKLFISSIQSVQYVLQTILNYSLESNSK